MTLKVALNYLVNQEVCRTTIVVGPHFVNMFLYCVYVYRETKKEKDVWKVTVTTAYLLQMEYRVCDSFMYFYIFFNKVYINFVTVKLFFLKISLVE